MQDFFEKDSYTEKDLSDLIKNNTEESLILEYKAAPALGFGDKKKQEISKDISSFANSTGGIVIYGIEEQNHIPIKFSFVDGNEFTKEWLEQVIHSNIFRKINNLEINPVRFDNNFEKSVYIVKIPESETSPHQAKDKRFYKRYNFESVAMEEYEIRHLYNKSARTELNIYNLILDSVGGTKNKGKYEYMNCFIKISVRNASSSLESDYKTEVAVPNIIKGNFTPSHESEKFIDRDEDNYTIYKYPNTSPLFQDETSTIDVPIPLRFNKNKFKDQSNFILRVNLYFSNGVKKKEFNLLEILKINGELINPDMFE